jgi:NADH:ubiquinone oxidoreductase subunit 4 (subunit M)
MPFFVSVFLIMTLANIGFPGTSSFVGEFLILTGIFQTNFIAVVLSGTSMVLGGGYALYLFNRICYGNLKLRYVGFFKDLNRLEFFILMPLVVIVFIMGIFPNIFLFPMESSVDNFIFMVKSKILSFFKVYIFFVLNLIST